MEPWAYGSLTIKLDFFFNIFYLCFLFVEQTMELTIVKRVTARIWMPDEDLKFNWMDEVNGAQSRDLIKVQQQQQQQQNPQSPNMQGLNRNYTQSRPMRPMGSGSPLSPTFQGDPMQRPPFNNGPRSPPFQGQQHPGGPMSPRPRPPMLAMGGGGGPMMHGGMPSPGRPQMSPGGGMGRPMLHPGAAMHQGGGGRPPRHPNQRMVCEQNL